MKQPNQSQREAELLADVHLTENPQYFVRKELKECTFNRKSKFCGRSNLRTTDFKLPG